MIRELIAFGASFLHRNPRNDFSRSLLSISQSSELGYRKEGSDCFGRTF